jgi:hypothetical protein
MTEQHEPASEHDSEIAKVFLDSWGGSSHPPEKWEKWAYAETDYAPEFLSADDLDGADPDSCVTVLDFSLCDPCEAPKGWRRVYQYAAGERACPWCGDGTGEEENRAQCKLCEGNGLLYWGEECQVVVFAPLPGGFAYGNGEPGCLHDHQDGPFNTQVDAAKAAAELLELTADEQVELATSGIVHFSEDRRHEVGAGMVEIFEVAADWESD